MYILLGTKGKAQSTISATIPGHSFRAHVQERDSPKRANKGTSEEIQVLENFGNAK